jgi:UDP-N-acetylmuramoyl-L-alanyl-D-glutamate--2,6-diaminopimelate ligase
MTGSVTKAVSLASLMHGVKLSNPCPDISIFGLASDSRDVKKGYIFFALQGSQRSGIDFIAEAIDRGAAAIAVDSTHYDEDSLLAINAIQVPVLAINNLVCYVSKVAGKFYADPSQNLSIVGVTGTNGKTTCAVLYADLSSQLKTALHMSPDKCRSGFIGTLGCKVLASDSKGTATADIVPLKSSLTTPDAISMQWVLGQLRERKVSNVSVEVSSHALAQERVAGVPISTAVFTNLSRDHLDYHGSLSAYANAKRKLFEMPSIINAIVNIDDNLGRSLLVELDPSVRVISFSLENISADIHCRKMTLSSRGFNAEIQTPWGRGEISSTLLGKFNLSNLLAVIAATVVESEGSEYENFKKLLPLIPNLKAVSGRMEMLDLATGPSVIIDYAHTPDALDKALQSLRLHCKGELWVVFGCGGDRDVGKRAAMGRVAVVRADQVVVTSDNPRTECPNKIINDILSGIKAKVLVESDRGLAIELAIHSAGTDDVVLIAGKGHEDYQIVGSERLPFSDQQQARAIIDTLTVQCSKRGAS